MVAEQQLHRVPGSDDRGIGVFTRVSTSPSDRNLIDLYADAGIEFIGLDDRRANDKFGIAVAYARVSKNARALDLEYRNCRLRIPVAGVKGFAKKICCHLGHRGRRQPNSNEGRLYC